jgi:hypothetical protein
MATTWESASLATTTWTDASFPSTKWELSETDGQVLVSEDSKIILLEDSNVNGFLLESGGSLPATT